MITLDYRILRILGWECYIMNLLNEKILNREFDRERQLQHRLPRKGNRISKALRN